jgi:hypothetical protein
MRFLRCAPLIALLFAAGCEVPIPSSIGMRLVNEVEMQIKDLAGAALLADLCADAGLDAETAPFAQAVARLTASQKNEFDDWQADAGLRSQIEGSVSRRDCKNHADDFRALGGKPIVIRQ